MEQLLGRTPRHGFGGKLWVSHAELMSKVRGVTYIRRGKSKDGTLRPKDKCKNFNQRICNSKPWMECCGVLPRLSQAAAI